MRATATRRTARRRRGGYLYVSVLMTSLVVSLVALVALSAAALRLRSVTSSNDWSAAQALARSATEDAVLTINGNPAWRTAYVNGTEYPTPVRSLNGGTYTWKLVDADGSLGDDDSDSVRVVGIGRVGSATVAESVRLLPTGAPLSCLEAALHCQGDLTLGAGVGFSTDQFLSSNGSVNASALLAGITGNVQAVGTITGSVTGTKTRGITPRRVPGNSAFEYYLDNGTWIPLSALPVISGAATLKGTVLSPLRNEYGAFGNPEGIYVIDCAGAAIRIQKCRIVGTIVLLNPASNSEISDSVRWDAAVANYPALLVAGSIQMKLSQLDLSESVTSTNFNPPNVPYSGNEDNDLLDSYPSEIKGLVYVSGNLDAPADLLESVFRGVTVCTSMSANSACKFNYRPLLASNPPPGFASGNPMVVSPGSRRRESLSP